MHGKGRLGGVIAALALVACAGAAPATPTPARVQPQAQLATAQAVAGATVGAVRPTPSPTPGAVAAVAAFRVWALEVQTPAELAGRRPKDGERLVRVDVLVENGQTRPMAVTPGALVGAGPGRTEDAQLRFELDGGAAPIAPVVDLYPPLLPVVLPPGYSLPETLLFSAPADLAPTRLVVRATRGNAQTTLELAAAGRSKPPLPGRAPYSGKRFAEAVDVLQGYQATVVAVSARDGRVRARVEVQNKTTSALDTGKLVAAQVVGADGDIRALESTDAPTLQIVDSKGSWEVVEPARPAGSWYAAREFRPVEVLLVLRSALHPDQVAEYATFLIPAEELSAPAPTPGLVTTLAGSTLDGYADGAGAAASFAAPVGIAVDAQGAVYVGDSHNNRVRRIGPDGVVATLAGGVTPGVTFADGPAADARFWEPRAVAVDAGGAVYVADAINNRIRRIGPDGQVTTVAGGAPGDADGPGADARFRYPRGVAVGAAGDVYVADKDNNRVRKITPAGVVSTLAGGAAGDADGPAADARFTFPEGVAVGTDGAVYVADTGNHRIRRIGPDGRVGTVAGGAPGFADGAGVAARFNTPRAVAVDGAGNLFVADAGNNRVRKVTPAGVVTTVAGSERGYANGVGPAARFDEPFGVAVDGAGNLYVADLNNNRVRKVVGPL